MTSMVVWSHKGRANAYRKFCQECFTHDEGQRTRGNLIGLRRRAGNGIMKIYETLHLVKGEDLNHHGTLFAARAAAWLVEAGFAAAACCPHGPSGPSCATRPCSGYFNRRMSASVSVLCQQSRIAFGIGKVGKRIDNYVGCGLLKFFTRKGSCERHDTSRSGTPGRFDARRGILDNNTLLGR